MGCKSSKAFKEKEPTFDIDAKAPGVVNTFKDDVPPSQDKRPPRTTASKPVPPSTQYRGAQSDTNAYLVSGTNPAMNPIYFPTPVVDPAPSHSGGCHSGDGHANGGYSGGSNSGGGGYSGGCDSGGGYSGGGYSGGCDSGGGFSSSSF
ncbi:hypothetical protein RhiXN_10023 [Rhizoctonia solani]|uniref:Uncharacterized protein n=1 Tax=Rhizoctonia solani TaxID=456999 RepID=A0A8H7HHQ0_9AGAM